LYASRKKSTAAALRSTERREREDAAPRLKSVIPVLVSLRIVVEDKGGLGVTKHMRHVIVDRAPALFTVPCGDASCDAEGHDITLAVMQALHAHRGSFEGEHGCDGNVGSAACRRVIHFSGSAQYAPG
jgi:hypothetical protein